MFIYTTTLDLTVIKATTNEISSKSLYIFYLSKKIDSTFLTAIKVQLNELFNLVQTGYLSQPGPLIQVFRALKDQKTELHKCVQIH
jgi:hypothetical protein